jgi:transposase
MPPKDSAEKAVRDIRRKTRRKFSAEEKIRIVLEGLRGADRIAAAQLMQEHGQVEGRGQPAYPPTWSGLRNV